MLLFLHKSLAIKLQDLNYWITVKSEWTENTWDKLLF